MTVNATSRGLPLATYKAQALLQPVGTQAVYYLGLIRTAIGANPKIRILEDAVMKYEDTIVGSLTIVSNYFLLPTAFNEPAETNVTDTLSGVCVLEIEKATDAAVALVVPLSLPAADPTDIKLDITSGLTAGIAVKTNDLRLLAPVTLDVVVGGGTVAAPPTSGIDQTILTTNEAGIVVPANFFGGSYQYHPTPRPPESWDGVGPADGPTLLYTKTTGSLRYHGTTWAAVYREGWQWYDRWKNHAKNVLNGDHHYVLFQTPNELAQSGYGSNRSFWPAFNPGGDMGNVPPVPGAAKAFAIELFTHDTELKTMDSWNEYEEVSSGYWRGNRTQMAAHMRELHEAKTQTGHQVKILWPAMVNWEWSGPNDAWQNWSDLAFASDGAGGQARDHIEGISHHIYMHPWSTTNEAATILFKCRASMAAIGKAALPKYMTECALLDDEVGDVASCSSWFARFFLLHAAFGYQVCNPWNMDVFGNWGGHRPLGSISFEQKHAQVKAAIHGKTIRWAYTMTNNTVMVGTNDGNTFSM